MVQTCFCNTRDCLPLGSLTTDGFKGRVFAFSKEGS